MKSLTQETRTIRSKGEVTLARQQEILFDISLEVGIKFQQMTVGLRENLIDSVNGSRGLFDHVKCWVDEFDKIWEAKPEDDREDYIFHVTEFAHVKFETLVKRAMEIGGRHALSEMRRPYKVRIDEHLNKIKACHTIAYALTEEESDWMYGAFIRLDAAQGLEQMNKVAHDMATLVSKVIVTLHGQGVTYVKLAEVMGLSRGRTQQLSDRYARYIRLGWTLPWAKGEKA